MLRRVALIAVIAGAFTAAMYTTDGCASAVDPSTLGYSALQGKVTDARTRLSVANAIVRVEQSNRSGSVRSDDGGLYFIGGDYKRAVKLFPGNARITVDAAGYGQFTALLALQAKDNHFDIELQPVS